MLLCRISLRCLHWGSESVSTQMHHVDLRYTKEELLLIFDQATKEDVDHGGQGIAAMVIPRRRRSGAIGPFLERVPRLMPGADAAEQHGDVALIVSRRDQPSRRPGACALIHSRPVQDDLAIGRQQARGRMPLGGFDAGERQ